MSAPDDSFRTGRCAECGALLSLEVGITNYGPEGGSKLFCTPCAPNAGSKGYTLSDLEKWREESQIMMDLVGPDVYFAVKGRRRRDDSAAR